MRYIILLIILVMSSCRSKEERVHLQDAQGGHVNTGKEIPIVNTTIWTNKTELFVEFPALVINNPSRFAAHFTILDNHQPVREGKVTVSLIKDGKGIRHTVEAPSSPGIFLPSLQPGEAGNYQLVFDIKTPAYHDRIVINEVRVFADTEEAITRLEGYDESGAAISFLKEQAWKIEFQTAPVIKGKIFDVVHTSGVWKAAPNAYKSLAANASGIVEFADGNLAEGVKVNKGQLLVTVSSKELTSNNLQTEIQKAEATFEQSKAEFERKKQLYESRIVAKAEFEQAESKYKVAKSSIETLKAGFSGGGKQIKAPFDGFIKSININNGDYVEQGASLITISNQRSSLLELQVNSSYSSKLQSIQNIWYQPKAGEWSSINESGGSVLSVGKQVEREKPMISVYAQVNEDIEMPQGSFTEVQIATGNSVSGLLIPENALLEDYGRYSVIVQLSGESFEIRSVTIGKRNGADVEIKRGLSTGEVVVTKGAYQVKMAAMSGQTPAHGHSH